MRLKSCVLCCALIVPAANAEDPKPAKAAGGWVTLTGWVVFPEGKVIPKREPLNVNVDKGHCLKNGPILDESVIVNPKNRGVRNVVVYLRPLDPKVSAFEKGQIHPDDAKRKPAQVVIDQPCCMFAPRITCARVGDTLVVKNPAPVGHNFFWSSTENGELNVTIPAGGKHVFERPLAAEPGAVSYSCSIHGWMKGTVRVFDHPYFAVTDEDGRFEIRNAPAGQFRVVFWHENGVRGGANGRFGEPVALAGKAVEMKPVEFDVTPGR